MSRVLAGSGARGWAAPGLWLLLAAGCARSCSGAPASEVTRAPASKPSAPPANAPGAAVAPDAATPALPADRATGADATHWLTLAQAFPDLPKGAERRRIVQLQHQLASAAPRAPTLATRAQLEPLFPAELDRLAASAFEEGPSQMGKLPVSVLARRYGSAGRTAFVRVVDAGQARELLAPVIAQLASIGDVQQGFAHGRLVHGHPAVASYLAPAQSSGLVAIVGNRYLIDVRVSHANGPSDAQTLFEALDVARLTPAGSKAGSH